jgi:hypothetical protein
VRLAASRRPVPVRASSLDHEEARGSVGTYLDELHVAAARLFGLEAAARDCCFGDVMATERIHLADATRQVELPPAAAFASRDTVAEPRARSRRD